MKQTSAAFNQVSSDLALEHLNRSQKVKGGLVGITLNTFTCDQSRLADDAHQMFGLSRNEANNQRNITKQD